MSEAPGPLGETTTDAFLGGAVQLRQPLKGLRAGLDGVLLAAACPAGPGDRVLDCGAGSGIVGLCVARRVPSAAVVLAERDPALVDLARQNIALNQLEARVEALTCDIAEPIARSPLSAAVGTFQHVLANPPYRDHGRGSRSPVARRDAASTMEPDALDRWLRFMAAMAAPDGTATLVHLAEALPALLQAFDGRFGNVLVLPIQPRAREPAHRVIISGVKGSRAPLSLLPALILHEDTGNAFRPAVDAILRSGAALPLAG